MPLLFTYFVFRVVFLEKARKNRRGKRGASSSLIVLYKVEVAAACSMVCSATLSILLFLVKLNLNAEEDEEERKRGRQSM